MSKVDRYTTTTTYTPIKIILQINLEYSLSEWRTEPHGSTVFLFNHNPQKGGGKAWG